MFCPQCGAEYIEGISMCTDCQVPLTPESSTPLHSKPDPVVLVTVMATGNEAVIPVAKSLLEDAGIEYLVQNEGFHGLFPVSRFTVQIQVRQDDEEDARELLSGLAEEG